MDANAKFTLRNGLVYDNLHIGLWFIEKKAARFTY